MDKQRSVMSYMMKAVGSNFFQGKSIMNVSLPIYISDYRSQVESYAYPTRSQEYLLEKAADASNIERLKIITTSTIAGFHTSMAPGKPFNPIIGETFQSKSGKSCVMLSKPLITLQLQIY